MSVYVTGDTHGPIDIQKLSCTRWPVSKYLTRDDYLIVLGDFGLIFDNEPSKDEIHWTRWLDHKNFTVLALDGNHENHPRLNALPVEEYLGGKVGRIADNIYHLKRGEIYTIEGKKFFVFGGAVSIDKGCRTEGVSWWREEVASVAEMDYGIANLEKHQWSVDYIMAHTAPQFMIYAYLNSLNEKFTGEIDPTSKYLSHICENAKFTGFYCGHWHDDFAYGQYHMLYHSIEKLF